jgi:ATP-dependent RNA helicase DeaD
MVVNMNEFKNFGLSENIMKALDSVGFTTPTEIQAKAIPMLLANKKQDFHGQAQTGTGKTLAFGIPLIEKIDSSKKAVQALIIAPTRELVLQIVESLTMLSKFYHGMQVEPIYGGVDMARQTMALRRGVHIVVGTPGRLNDHLRRGNLNLSNLNVLVLDEADIMLDMGFKQDIDIILERSPKDRSIWLFSATNKSGVDDIKRSHMKDPESVRAITKNTASASTDQYYCVTSSKYRLQALSRILDKDPSFYGIIFCQTKLLCAEIASKLSKRGCNSASIHGDMDQKMRNKVIQKFKDKEIDILVATDVVARGIDVNNLTHVVNYSLPEDQESYIHRVGRTGRAGKKGVAITFISSREESKIKSLARRFGTDIKPYEIPTLQDIITSKVQDAVAFLNDSCQEQDNSSNSNPALNALKETIQDLPKEKIVNAIINLLSDKFLKTYKDEEEIPTSFDNERSFSRSDRGGERSGRFDRGDRGGERRGRGEFERSTDSRERDLEKWKGQDMSELILHVGSDDGFERDDILQYCLNAKVADRDQIGRVRVIKKRSFVVLPTKFAKKAVVILNGKTLQNKKIRVSVASL